MTTEDELKREIARLNWENGRLKTRIEIQDEWLYHTEIVLRMADDLVEAAIPVAKRTPTMDEHKAFFAAADRYRQGRRTILDERVQL